MRLLSSIRYRRAYFPELGRSGRPFDYSPRESRYRIWWYTHICFVRTTKILIYMTFFCNIAKLFIPERYLWPSNFLYFPLLIRRNKEGWIRTKILYKDLIIYVWRIMSLIFIIAIIILCVFSAFTVCELAKSPPEKEINVRRALLYLSMNTFSYRSRMIWENLQSASEERCMFLRSSCWTLTLLNVIARCGRAHRFNDLSAAKALLRACNNSIRHSKTRITWDRYHNMIASIN